MHLVALSLVKDEQYWIWYSLTSVYPHVDRILFFDNHSEDATLDIVRSMEHIADKLTITERFGGEHESTNRELCLDVARRAGGTHVLWLDGDELHVDEDLAFARRLLDVTEHTPPLADPPRNHGRSGDHQTTDGVLIKNVGFKPIHPGFAGPRTCIEADWSANDHDHGCYNFAIRIASLANLRGNGKEWGEHGYLETGGLYIQSSPHTLWCPKLHYYHMRYHERSPARERLRGRWVLPVQDLGSKAVPAHVCVPSVLFRPDGPSNPTLVRWGLREAPPATPR